jgi:hypothetical protein
MAAEEDWLIGFLAEFASMSEAERDAAIDSLPPESRDELLALARARAATADADLIEILNAGQDGLEKLHRLGQPLDVLTVINLAVREQPSIVVEALFAAVVLHREWDEGVPAAIVALRERWYGHLREQVAAAQERKDDDPDGGA